MDDNKSKALAAALSQIEKQFGKGSIMKMDAEAIKDIEVVSTGSLGLDLALGVGGCARQGRRDLRAGVLRQDHAHAAGHRRGAEGGRHGGLHRRGKRARRHLRRQARREDEDLLISQPDTGEQALEIADMLVRSGAVDVIVIDSVAALTPKAEIEGEMGEPQMGLQARLMSQALRKLTSNIKRTNTLVIFINQIRMKIGVLSAIPRPPPAATRSSSMPRCAWNPQDRLDQEGRRGGRLRDARQGGEEQGGAAFQAGRVRYHVRRRHLARRRSARDRVNLGVLEKSGAWYIHHGDRLGQGKDNARDFLKENPQLAREIEAKIREKAASPSPLRPPRSRRKKKRLSTSLPASAAELRQRALRLLARREHSRAELARSLRRMPGRPGAANTPRQPDEKSSYRTRAMRPSARAGWRASTALRASATICARKASPKSWSRAPAPATTSSSRQALPEEKVQNYATTREERARRARFLQGRGFSYERSAARWISPATTPLCS